MRPLGLLLLLSVMGSGLARAQEPEPVPAPPSANLEVNTDPEEEEYDPHGVAAMRQDDLDDAAARNRYTVASALYESGRFVEAATEFETAFELSRRSSLLFNAYLAWRDAGRLADAVRTLDHYLRETPDAEDHVRLNGRLNAMRMSLEQQTSAEQVAEAERERLAEEAVEERRRADEERRRADEARRDADAAGPHPVGFIVAGVGVAAMLASIVPGVLASGDFADLKADCPGFQCTADVGFGVRRKEILVLQRATDGLLFGGLAVATVGALLILFVTDGGSEDVQPSASCTGSGCSAGLRGSF